MPIKKHFNIYLRASFKDWASVLIRCRICTKVMLAELCYSTSETCSHNNTPLWCWQWDAKNPLPSWDMLTDSSIEGEISCSDIDAFSSPAARTPCRLHAVITNELSQVHFNLFRLGSYEKTLEPQSVCNFRLVLSSRSGIRTGYQARCVHFWRRTGISVLISTLNITKEEDALELIAQCLSMGPLGGVFHLAMVLRDCLFENQNVQNFKDAAEAKYWGTLNLDAATRKACGKELRWFVLLVFMKYLHLCSDLLLKPFAAVDVTIRNDFLKSFA